MPDFGVYNSLMYGIGLVIGILLNIFIGKIVRYIFKKDNTATRFPVRFIGVVLVLNCGYYFLLMMK